MLQPNNPQTPQRRYLTADVRNTVLAIQEKRSIGPDSRRSIALRDLARAVFQHDGMIDIAESKRFRDSQGITLARGVSHYKYVRGNLNGDWSGTGLFCDGNYYAGPTALCEAITEYGFDHSTRWGWATAFKLHQSATVADYHQLENISQELFIETVQRSLAVPSYMLRLIYEPPNDIAFRAVLMGYDATKIPDFDHYVVHNNGKLICSQDTTPWFHKIEPIPPEFLNQPSSPPSYAQIQREIASLGPAMDKDSFHQLQYAPAARRARIQLKEAITP